MFVQFFRKSGALYSVLFGALLMLSGCGRAPVALLVDTSLPLQSRAFSVEGVMGYTDSIPTDLLALSHYGEVQINADNICNFHIDTDKCLVGYLNGEEPELVFNVKSTFRANKPSSLPSTSDYMAEDTLDYYLKVTGKSTGSKAHFFPKVSNLSQSFKKQRQRICDGPQ